MRNKIQGHLPRKRFGQHFLTDKNIIANIIDIIHPKNGEVIIEIGPGLGALTELIVQIIDDLTVIELDRDLAARLKANPFLNSKLTICQQDAMTYDFSTDAEKKNQLLRIFGNIPYNISTPLIFYLFKYLDVIKDIYFMLQKELVHRLIARPGSKDYGRLSIMAQYYCQIIAVLTVARESFTPSPKVDSVLVKMIPYKKIPYPVKEINSLNRITIAAFSKRRKTIRNSLGHFFSDRDFNNMNIDNALRAENITLAQYCKLANWLTVHHDNPKI